MLFWPPNSGSGVPTAGDRPQLMKGTLCPIRLLCGSERPAPGGRSCIHEVEIIIAMIYYGAENRVLEPD